MHPLYKHKSQVAEMQKPKSFIPVFDSPRNSNNKNPEKQSSVLAPVKRQKKSKLIRHVLASSSQYSQGFYHLPRHSKPFHQ